MTRLQTWITTLLLSSLLLSGCDFRLNPSSLPISVVRLPYSSAPISFDDLSYDPRLDRLIVPSAEAGVVALIDPVTKSEKLVEGFSKQVSTATPVAGTTSATTAKGYIFALDRTTKTINVVDPGSLKIIRSTQVQDVPDYIRFVAATNELWVTERAIEQIEVFKLGDGQPPTITKSTPIAVPNGPEALLIDKTRGLAYTNQPKTGETAVIQVMTHNIIYEWGNGCSKSRGLAIDEDLGLLFVACGEGKVVMMDLQNGGLQITSQTYGSGLDFVAYNPSLKHLYVPSGKSAIVAIFGLVWTPVAPQATPTPLAKITGAEDNGAATPVPAMKVSLVRLGTADTVLNARCVVADGHDQVWVCDPNSGQLIVIHDTFPPNTPGSD